MSTWGRTDQEARLQAVFAGLEADFKRLDKAKGADKAQALLKDITAKLKDAKVLIQEFEREARTDGMPTRELVDRKRQLVGQFNTYVNLKKQHASTEAGRGELLAGAAPVDGQAAAATSNPYDGVAMQELMKEGRKNVKEIDGTLNRAEKLVEDTLQIGQQTAATLHDQTQQLNKVVDDLNEIEFTMKKASKVIADIGKGIMTDRCIMFLLFLVVCGVVALVVVKVIKPNQKAIQDAAATVTPTSVSNFTSDALGSVQGVINQLPGQGGSRRLLLGRLLAASSQQHAQQHAHFASLVAMPSGDLSRTQQQEQQQQQQQQQQDAPRVPTWQWRRFATLRRLACLGLVVRRNRPQQWRQQQDQHR